MVPGSEVLKPRTLPSAKTNWTMPGCQLPNCEFCGVVGDWASGHDGNVLVEKREWTSAIALATRSSPRSGKNAGTCAGVSIPLYVIVREDSDGK